MVSQPGTRMLSSAEHWAEAGDYEATVGVNEYVCVSLLTVE